MLAATVSTKIHLHDSDTKLKLVFDTKLCCCQEAFQKLSIEFAIKGDVKCDNLSVIIRLSHKVLV